MVLFGRIQPTGNCRDVYQAAAEGNLGAIEYWVDALRKYKADVRNANNETLAHLSARAGHLNVVQWCIGRNENFFITAEDNLGNSIMHAALRGGSLTTVQYLTFKNDTFLRMHRNHENDTVLHAAARYGRLEAVQFFVTAWKMKYDLRNSAGETPAHLAAKYDHLTVLAWLVYKYAPYIHATDNKRNYVLHWTATTGNAGAIYELCRRYHADAEVYNLDGQYPIHVAVENRHLNATRVLVEECNTSPLQSQKLSPWNTAIHVAAAAGSVDALKYFIGRGFDVNEMKNDLSQTPIIAATIRDSLPGVKYLVGNGADAAIRDSKGNTVLHYAALNRNLDIPKYLLDERRIPLKLDSRNHLGDTILYAAAQYDNLAFIRYVVEEKNARYVLDMPTSDGKTPLMEVVSRNNFTMVKYLALNGNNVGWRDNHGKAAADFAVDEKVRTFLQSEAVNLPFHLRRIGRARRMVQSDQTLDFDSTRKDYVSTPFRRLDGVLDNALLAAVTLKKIFKWKSNHSLGMNDLPLLPLSPREIVRNKIDPVAIAAIHDGPFGQQEN